MANNRRKSAAIALAVIGIAGLSLASASTLGIGTGTLQAGTQNLTDCQSGDVQASVASAGWDDAAGAFLAGRSPSAASTSQPEQLHRQAHECPAPRQGRQVARRPRFLEDRRGLARCRAPSSVDVSAIEGVAIVIAD